MTSSVWTAVLLMAGFSYVMSATNVVEVYFVVEPQVVRNYVNLGYDAAKAQSTIKTDINYFILQMNKFFGSMSSYGLSIEIRAKKVTIMTAELFQKSDLQNEKYINTFKTLDIFKAWLKSNNAYSTVGYDLALVYTGYDLASSDGSSSVSGFANLGATCREEGIAAVEFDGTMSTATVTAHEIGHSLGATHVTSTSTPCSSPHKFIMTPSYNYMNDKRWFFSACSATAISNYIKTLSTNCLTTTTAPAPTMKMEDFALEDILDVTKQCQRETKNIKGYHRTPAYIKGDDLCRGIHCGVRQVDLYNVRAPSDGIVCDNNKRCDKGICVTSSIPTGNRDPNCLYGDIDAVYFNEVKGQTCETFFASNLLLMCTWLHNVSCCKYCGDRKKTIPGCEWGDTSSGCDPNNMNICINDNNKKICCEMCHGYQGKRSVSSNSTVVLKADSVTLPKLNEAIEENDDSPVAID